RSCQCRTSTRVSKLRIGLDPVVVRATRRSPRTDRAPDVRRSSAGFTPELELLAPTSTNITLQACISVPHNFTARSHQTDHFPGPIGTYEDEHQCRLETRGSALYSIARHNFENAHGR